MLFFISIFLYVLYLNFQRSLLVLRFTVHRLRVNKRRFLQISPVFTDLLFAATAPEQCKFVFAFCFRFLSICIS